MSCAVRRRNDLAKVHKFEPNGSRNKTKVVFLLCQGSWTKEMSPTEIETLIFREHRLNHWTMGRLAN